MLNFLLCIFLYKLVFENDTLNHTVKCKHMSPKLVYKFVNMFLWSKYSAV